MYRFYTPSRIYCVRIVHILQNALCTLVWIVRTLQSTHCTHPPEYTVYACMDCMHPPEYTPYACTDCTHSSECIVRLYGLYTSSRIYCICRYEFYAPSEYAVYTVYRLYTLRLCRSKSVVASVISSRRAPTDDRRNPRIPRRNEGMCTVKRWYMFETV